MMGRGEGAEGRRRLSYAQQWAILVAVLVGVDVLAICAGLSLAYLVRLSSGLLAYTAPYDPAEYRVFVLVSVPVWLLIFAGVGLYKADNLLGGMEEYTAVLYGCVGGVIAIIVLSFFWREAVSPSRGWLLLAWGFTTALVGGGRFAVRRLAYAFRRRGYLTARVLIVGANDQGIAMAEQWLRSPLSGMAVAGFLDDFKPVGTAVIDGLEVLARPTALEAVARQVDAQEIVVVSSAVAWETFEEIVGRSPRRNGYIVRLSPGFYATLGTGVAVSNKTFVPLFTVNETRLTGFEAALKWLADHTLGLILCLAALPLMAVIAAGLKWATPRAPLLDRHEMLGLGGVPFAMWKFHTEGKGEALPPRRIVDGELASEGNRIGAAQSPGSASPLLIRSGLDKLPQLFNVLAGQMSLVGPRPRAAGGDHGGPHEALNLLTVKPGIIGPWTVSSYWTSGGETLAELHYVRNWTVWLDLQVILQTLWRWLRLGRGGAQGSG